MAGRFLPQKDIDLMQLSITFSLLKVTITIVKVCLDIDIWYVYQNILILFTNVKK